MEEDRSESQIGLSAAKHALLAKRLRGERLTGPAIDAIPRRSSAAAPLSFSQEQLWFLDRLHPGNAAYTITRALRMRGRLNHAALEQSLAAIMQRHEVLRTTVAELDGRPTQVVGPACPPALPLHDLSRLPEAARVAVACQLIKATARQPFDLAKGPLLRAQLLRAHADEHILLLSLHHIVFDGWSFGVLWDELATLYAAFDAGGDAALPELPIQYTDFAAWQRGQPPGTIEPHLAYWRQHLAGAPTMLDLPTDRPRPPIQTFNGATQPLHLPAQLVASLQALSRQEGVTLLMTMLAAFTVLLGRYSRQSDVVAGLPIANRSRSETQGLIGFFANTLALRVSLAGGPSFCEVLRRVREGLLDAHDHQELPFEQLVAALQPERDLGYSPLIQASFAYLSLDTEQPALPGLEVDIQAVPSGTAKLDLALELNETPSALSGQFEYNTDLFDAATVARMVGHYQQLLTGVVAAPEQPVARLPLLGHDERRRLLDEWNATDAPFPHDRCIQHLIVEQAGRSPDAVAVVFEDRQLSYGALLQRASQLAHQLQRHGVGPEQRVAIYSDNLPELVVGVLGVLLAGGAALPLDPSYPAAHLAHMLADAQPAVLLTAAAGRQLPASAPVIDLVADWPMIARNPSTPPATGAIPENSAYVIYTSGSTGQPKGVIVTQRNLVNSVVARLTHYPRSTTPARHLLFSSIAFDISVSVICWPLCSGGVLVLPPSHALRDLEQGAAVIARQRITHVMCALALYRALLTPETAASLAALHHVMVGGETCPPALMALHRALLPQTRISNEYGPTECTVWSTSYAYAQDEAPSAVPIGRPIANTQVYLLDPQFQLVPPGVPGELYIGGAGVARGYLGRPELTAERFVPNPFATPTGTPDFQHEAHEEHEEHEGDEGYEEPGHAPAQRPAALDNQPATQHHAAQRLQASSLTPQASRLYRTGDLARYQPDGQLMFLGRIDEQIKLRGFRIEPGEVEATLRQHPAVCDVVVLAREDTPGDQRLVAYVVPAAGCDPELSGAPPIDLRGALRDFVCDRLPSTMVPSAIVLLGALPLTPNGKLDRRALPVPAADAASADFVAPRTAVEELLAAVWADLLGLERVGVHDDFFALGGHSLLAVRAVARVRDLLAVDLPLQQLFDTPSVAALAVWVEQAQRADTVVATPPPLQAAEREDPPLSFAQQRLWFLDRFALGDARYNVPLCLRLRGPLDRDALQHSLEAISARHAILRTRFPAVDGRPIQQVDPPQPLAMAFHDLRARPPAARAACAHALLDAAAKQPFDLACGPLLRVLLVALDATEHLLLLVWHHIIIDGWSLGVLWRELATLYAAARAGQATELPPLPLQYADYAAWQRAWLTGAPRERLLAYWRQQLAGAPALLALPTDHPRPPVQSFVGGVVPFVLPAALTAGLRSVSQQAGATLFMTLLAAFAVLLGRYARQDDLVVGTPVAGRSRSELEDLIGCFVNTLALRVQVAGNPRFGELLAQVRDTALAAYAHQELPFEQLVEALQPARELGHAPIVQVVFAFQNSAAAAGALADLDVQPYDLDIGTAKFDLSLGLEEGPQGLLGTLEYNTNLFDAATAARMAQQYQTLLAGIVSDPAQRIADLPLLAEDERQRLLVDWNATQLRYPNTATIPQLFAEQVARTPDATALVAGDIQLSYRMVYERANRLAHQLQAQGVGPEVRVGICLERTADLLIALLGVLTGGGAYVPLDPAYPTERLAFMVEDAQLAVLLTHERLAAQLPDCGAQLIYLDREGAEHPASPPPCAATAANLAYVLFTSGSTGRPKGVAISHRCATNFVSWARSHFSAAEVAGTLAATSINFDLSIFELFVPLTLGGCVILAENALQLPSLPHAAAVTLINTVPAAMAELLRMRGVPNSVQTINLAGEPLPDRLARQVYAETSAQRLFNLYGPTEATTYSTVALVERGASQAPNIGHPIANTQVYLLDSQLRPVPSGVPGEVYIGGDGVARGYLGRPALTAERFVPNPFALPIQTPDMQHEAHEGEEGWKDQAAQHHAAPDHQPVTQNHAASSQASRLKPHASRLYRTGDLARHGPDSALVYLGRIDTQVKLRGFRIELSEIEAVLSDHPAVQAGVVVVREDRRGEQMLVAYVVPSGGDQPQSRTVAAELLAHLQAQLPEYMVPSTIVILDALPLTPNGKIDREALPRPAPEPAREEQPLVPQDSLEQAIAAVWRAVLHIDKVGLHSNFFDLGGHSLLIARVHTQLQTALKRDIALLDLFKYPTISVLASFLRQEQSMDIAAVAARRPAPAAGDIAVVGMAVRLPGARDVAAFWQNLCAGVESIRTFSEAELIAAGVTPSELQERQYVRAGAPLDGAELFDAAFFGYTARAATVLNPQHRILLECAWEALEDAGYDPETYPGAIGVYAGAGLNNYLAEVLANRDVVESVGSFQAVLGSDKDHAPTTVSYRLNLRGPSVAVQTACSTSLVAIHMACQSLTLGECDMALAGGVAVQARQIEGYRYQEGSIMSPDGHCRTFDARAQGTVRGNGAGLVVLKRLGDALEDGDRIYAVVKGSALNNDGARKVGYTAPAVAGQADVIRRALDQAGVSPATISYIEAHGTGTPLGDPIEVAALRQVFGAASERGQSCGLGSVKTNIGHLDTAAGVVGFIKTVLALYHRQIPPSLHFEQPNPKIDFADGPFYVSTSLADWPTGETPRRAGVSSFGMGGTNAHAILEEAPPVEPAVPARPAQLLILSAKTETALASMTARLCDHLRQHPDLSLPDIAYTLQVGRQAFGHRQALVCCSSTDACAALAGHDPARLRSAVAPETARPVVFLFAGQGSQHPGMAQELYVHEPIFRAAVDRCAELLEPTLGLDLRALLYPPDQQDAQQLGQTAYAQPALFVTEYALAQLWMAWGVRPQAMIGHSIGEYVAACVAGVFTLEDALGLVAARGQLMQTLPPGAMLAVPLSEADLQPYLAGQPGLAVATINAPARCVVAGPTDLVAALHERLTAANVQSRQLHTSHAFHSAMVDPAVGPFVEYVRRITLRPPTIPYISNVSGTWITDAEATDPGYWGQHLRQPVQFAQGLATLASDPAQIWLEVGPDQTLSNLARLQAHDHPVVASLGHSHTRDTDVAHVLEAAGRLWLAGASVDWAALHADQGRRRVSLPTYPFDHQPYWVARACAGAPAHQQEAEPLDPTQLNQQEVHVTAPTQSQMPRSARHARIASMLQTLFGRLLGVAEVDGTTPFVELGADSLLLLQASQSIQDTLDVHVPFRLLLEEYTTAETLATYLDAQLPPERAAEQVAHNPTPEAAAQAPSTAVGAPTPGLLPPAPAAAPANGLEQLLLQQMQLMHQQSQIMAQQLAALNSARSANGAPPQPPLPPAAAPPNRVTPAASTGSAPPRPAATDGPQALSLTIDPTPFVPYQPIRTDAGKLTPQQQQHLDALIARYTRRTQGSKRNTETYRPHHADNRASAGFRLPWKELVYQIMGERASGAHLWDVDGNEYVDLTMGFGALLFGHSPDFLAEALVAQVQRGVQIGPQSPLAGQVAALLCELTGAERAAFANSGTEAVMMALRLARMATGRQKIAMFAGSFHGTFDGVLARGQEAPDGSLRTLPVAPGVAQHMVDNVLMLRYVHPESLDILRAHAHEIAAVLVEPRQSRRPDVDPHAFLAALRQLTEETGIVLIFDEVVTGFRMHPGGIQALLNIRADITTYGKAVANGLPIGVVAGKAAYLDAFDGGCWNYGDDSYPPAQQTYVAGTFFRNPLSMAAAYAVLSTIKERGPQLQELLNQRTTALAQELNAYLTEAQVPIRVVHFGSLFRFYYPPDLRFMDLFFYHMIDRGVYIWEARNCFLSTAHSDADIALVVRAVKESVAALQQDGFLPGGLGPVDGPGTPADAADSGAKPPDCHGASAIDQAKAPMRPFRLTDAQKELWVLAQLGDDAARAYHEPLLLQLHGPLDLAALRAAFQQVIERHEAIRLTFSPQGDYQQADPSLTLAIPLIDLAQDAAPEAQFQVWLADALAQPFDLARGPLLRVTLVRLAAEHHTLVLVAHHLITDGWSNGVILGEVGALYSAACQGRSCELPAPMPYSAYVDWQAGRQQRPEHATTEAYWLRQLAGPLPPLELPTDWPRPSEQTFVGAVHHATIAPDVTQRLKDFSAQQRVTLFTTLLAAFGALLHRLSGQDDLVIGIPAAGQAALGTRPLVGYCVTMLPLRSRVAGDLPFADYMDALRRTLLDAYDHQGYPLTQLIKRLQLPRDPSRSPLLAATFNLDRASVPAWHAVRVEPTAAPVTAAKFELDLNITELDDSLLVEWNYNTDLFDAQTIGRWHAHLCTLLECIVAEPQRPLATLQLLRDAQRQEYAAWNSTRTALPAGCIHQLIAAQAQQTPDALAVVGAGAQLTYGELEGRANQLAHELRQRGVGPEVRVAVCMERTSELIVALLGVLKAGGAYVPLDPSYPHERLAYMLEDSNAAVLLTAAQAGATARLPMPRLCQLLDLHADTRQIAQQPASPPPDQTLPEHMAYVIYTSGSTGRPKGVAISHCALLNYTCHAAETYALRMGDRVLQFAPISFDVSVEEIFPSLLRGATMVLRDEAMVGSVALFLKTCAAWGVTVLNLPTAYWHELAAQLRSESLALPPAVRLVIIGSEQVLPERLAAWHQCAGPGVRLVNAYGPTEATVAATCCDLLPPTAGQPPQRAVPIGWPIANAEVYVLDDQLQPVPIGVVGELYIGGVGLARGYLGRPDLTAERFIPNPFAASRNGMWVDRHEEHEEYEGHEGRVDQAHQNTAALNNQPAPQPHAAQPTSLKPQASSLRLYRTGDLGHHRADGALVFVGRRDHQVKVRGYRIELGEIEAVLGQHPALRDTVVVVREDTPGDKRLVAYVVPQHQPPPTVGELRDLVLRHLPDYMVPSAFVTLEALPLTPNGKLDRRALMAPGVERPALEQAYVAPLTQTEQLLAQIWSQVLGVAQIGIHDNFFELGGDSILSLQITARANEAGLQLMPRQVFRHQTIAALAAVAGSGPLVRAGQDPLSGPVALTPIQRWFFEQRLADQHHWNQAVLLEPRQPLNPAIVEQALQHILCHHDALRLRFCATEAGWEQRCVLPEQAGLPLERIDLLGLPQEQQADAITAAASALQAGLNITDGPLVRAALFELDAPSPGRLLIVIHHLAIDIVSWRVLLDAFQTAYQQIQQGQPVRLPPKTTSFQEWADRLHAYAQSPRLRSELSYWLAAQRNNARPLPRDSAGGHNTEASSQTVVVELGADDTRVLIQATPKVYQAQVSDVLLTALAQALCDWTGQPTLLVDLEGHGRESLFDDVDLSRTVGWFTSMYPVLLTPGALPREAVQTVTAQLRQVPNGGIGYGLLRYVCDDPQVRQQLAALPMAEVCFNYQGVSAQAIGQEWLIRQASESSGPSHAPQALRTHLLEINGLVAEGRLSMHWTYSEQIHHRAAIERLAQRCMAALRALIAQAAAEQAGDGSPGHETKLNPKELQKVLAKVSFGKQRPQEHS